MKYLLLLLGFLAACVDNDLSLTVVRFVAVDQETMCVAKPDATISQGGGTLDVGLVEAGMRSNYRGYQVAPVVQNNLVDRQVTGGVQTDSIFVTGFDIELRPDPRDPEVTAALPPAQRKGSYPVAGGRLEPGAGGAVSQAAIIVEAIGASQAIAISRAIPEGRRMFPLIARLRPIGQRAGGLLNGGWVDFPIDICKFCLSPPPTMCPTGGKIASEVQLGSCYPWQDAAVTCCTSGDGQLLCGVDVPTASM